MKETSDFVRRLRQIFGGATMAGIARRLSLPHATVRNYFGGRLPAPEVLIRIAETTGVSLNWLLTGRGPVYLSEASEIDIDAIIERKIEAAISRKLAGSGLPTSDDARRPTEAGFDLEAALDQYADPDQIMSEWFRFEGKDYPQDFGVVFFTGWESFSREEKLDAIRDARKVLERNLKSGGK